MRSDSWGQGARSALPMVGDFFQQAIRNKVIDGQERFFDEFDTSPPPAAMPPPPGDGSLGTMRDWIRGLFGGGEGQPAPQAPGQPPAPWPGGLPPVTQDPPGSSMPPPPAEERSGG